MNASLNPKLHQVQSQIEHGDHSALDRFWQELREEGAPLIEAAGPGFYDVTFVWQASGDIRHVAVLQDWGADGIREHQMMLLPNTNIWYKTRRFAAGTRTTYQMSPSTSSDPHEPGSYHLDPFNPKRHRAFKGETTPDIWFSLLELPGTPAQPWKEASVSKGAIELHHPTSDERRIWVYHPPAPLSPRTPLLLVFDGRLFKEMLDLPAMLDYLTAEQRILPPIALFIDNPDQRELVCDAAFAQFITGQIIPWARATFRVDPDPAYTFAIGSSFGGLAAAFLALHHSHIVGNVLSQTGWFRWRPDGDPEFEWITRQFATALRLPIRFYLDVGSLETARMRDDGPNQLVTNRHFRTVLQAKGYPIHYREYLGGHDYSSTETPLFDAISLLLTPTWLNQPNPNR